MAFMFPEVPVIVVGIYVDWRRWKGWNHNGHEARLEVGFGADLRIAKDRVRESRAASYRQQG